MKQTKIHTHTQKEHKKQKVALKFAFAKLCLLLNPGFQEEGFSTSSTSKQIT